MSAGTLKFTLPYSSLCKAWNDNSCMPTITARTDKFPQVIKFRQANIWQRFDYFHEKLLSLSSTACNLTESFYSWWLRSSFAASSRGQDYPSSVSYHIGNLMQNQRTFSWWSVGWQVSSFASTSQEFTLTNCNDQLRFPSKSAYIQKSISDKFFQH